MDDQPSAHQQECRRSRGSRRSHPGGSRSWPGSARTILHSSHQPHPRLQPRFRPAGQVLGAHCWYAVLGQEPVPVGDRRVPGSSLPALIWVCQPARTRTSQLCPCDALYSVYVVIPVIPSCGLSPLPESVGGIIDGSKMSAFLVGVARNFSHLKHSQRSVSRSRLLQWTSPKAA